MRFRAHYLLLILLCGCNLLKGDSTPETNAEIVLRFAQWNIGHFDYGYLPNSRIGPLDYYPRLQQYRELLNDLDVDLIALCEYSEIFGKSDTGVQYSRGVLFNSYPFYYEGSLVSTKKS